MERMRYDRGWPNSEIYEPPQSILIGHCAVKNRTFNRDQLETFDY